MDTTEAIMTVMVVGMVVGIPMMAVSVRLALKPMVEAWTRLREAETRRPATSAAELEAVKLRLAALEAIWEQRLGAGTLQPTVTPPRLVD